MIEQRDDTKLCGQEYHAIALKYYTTPIWRNKTKW